jgi:hypothetical protein
LDPIFRRIAINVVYCVHQNNEIARLIFFANICSSLLPLTAASLSAGVCMYFTPYLDDFDVDRETKRALGVALEKTRVSLGLADNFANGIIAKRIVELAKAGERNPDLLCEGTLNKLREHLYGD